ncbi:MAG TPA: hypothetical protein VKZ63_14725 [Kofleriaceae bacterium]|nr:hypothetical protein [Kofleriaceae bacterium]
MLKDELRQLLRELAAATGAASVSIAHPDQHDGDVVPDEAAAAAPHSMAVPVGGGAVLRAGFLYPEDPPDPNGRAAALERTARALRSCARRWDVATLPPVSYPESARSPRSLILARIESYLRALVSTLSMENAAVTLRGRLVTSARPLGELHREQIPFTVRRVAAEVERRRGTSSHAELAGEDFYALSFWYGGCLIGFFSSPYAPDFVRHRTRLVTRELAHLLSMLDEPPSDPVQTAPRPE